MSNDMRCGDPAALAGYLYDEIDPAERNAVERHLMTCEVCASEIEGLRGTRTQLASWTPPETRLGFRVVADGAVPDDAAEKVPAVRRGWWQWSAVPAWAQAAAAVMLFAGGALVAALMNMEVRYDQAGGVTIRTGWQQASAPAAPAASAPGTQTVSARDLAALESRIRAEFTQARSAEESGKGVIGTPSQEPGAGTVTALASLDKRAPGGDVMQRVRQLVSESEQRQQRELQLRIGQVVRDLDSTHRADLARIERTVSPMEGVTTEELRQQRQMLNYLMRVSQQK